MRSLTEINTELDRLHVVLWGLVATESDLTEALARIDALQWVRDGARYPQEDEEADPQVTAFPIEARGTVSDPEVLDEAVEAQSTWGALWDKLGRAIGAKEAIELNHAEIDLPEPALTERINLKELNA